MEEVDILVIIVMIYYIWKQFNECCNVKCRANENQIVSRLPLCKYSIEQCYKKNHFEKFQHSFMYMGIYLIRYHAFKKAAYITKDSIKDSHCDNFIQ